MQFPEVDFQDAEHACCGDDNDLSHSSALSSIEPHYCKPRVEHQEGWDTMTCASSQGLSSYTDKGVFSPTTTTGYPPRADLQAGNAADSPSVAMYKMLDPFDAVSQATPAGGAATAITWHMPPGFPTGNYVLWIEVAQEILTDDPDGNSNATYNSTTYPSPSGINFADYGIPYRGQPSIVYRTPFTFGGGATSAVSTDYVGYGDPAGVDGAVNPPDATITTAASRLQLVSDGSASYRVRVQASDRGDTSPPGAATETQAIRLTATSATVSFVAPASGTAKVTSYDMRYLAYAPITDADFGSATEVATGIDAGRSRTSPARRDRRSVAPDALFVCRPRDRRMWQRRSHRCDWLHDHRPHVWRCRRVFHRDRGVWFGHGERRRAAARVSRSRARVERARRARGRELLHVRTAGRAGGRQLGAPPRERTRCARSGGRSRAYLEATMIRKSVLAALVLAAATGAGARADTPGVCHFVDVDFTPSADLQIVMWIEDTSGNYVDTAYITQATGTYGIGNRPGRFDFNSAPKWPYGRRITTFPVWSHKHGMTFPEIDFQDGEDSDLSHGFNQSSHEQHFCRPLLPSEYGSGDPDATTCATMVYTDKGVFSTTNTSNYPPRIDVTPDPGTDSDSVAMYASMNPFDGVSQATPPGGTPATLTWTPPSTVPAGNYVLWLEVSKESDMDDTYNATSYPSPTDINYAEYGAAYRGQPSVVYNVPFTIGGSDSIATSSDYVGYGDPDGLDGNIRPPDATILTTVPGSGGARLQLVTDGSGAMYRVQAHARVDQDSVPPAAPTNLKVTFASPAEVVSFTAPGDDGGAGMVSSYDIRLAVGAPITDATFDSSPRIASPAQLVPGGQTQTIKLDNLLPDTDYSIAIRATDDCNNTGPIAITAFHTSIPQGEVDACFIATAAYGSKMAADVGMLRHFRDVMLRRSALGELFVETYYTFGPPVAHVVGESDLLRASARDALGPLVERVRAIVF